MPAEQDGDLQIPRGKAVLKLGDRRGQIVLTPLEFDAHCRDARILERKRGRPTLLAHVDSDGTRLLTRVWYPKGRWSSDRFWPYSDRFRRALAALKERGIRVPVETAHGEVAGTGIRIVVHEALAGTPLRGLRPEPALKGLAGFLADLHARGVYCRGLHLGNVLALEGGGFGLSDVSDTRLLDRPLTQRMRERNLGILCVHPVDFEGMLDGRWSDLVMDYCRAASLSIDQAAQMRDRVRGQMERRQARREGRVGFWWLDVSGGSQLLAAWRDRLR